MHHPLPGISVVPETICPESSASHLRLLLVKGWIRNNSVWLEVLPLVGLSVLDKNHWWRHYLGLQVWLAWWIMHQLGELLLLSVHEEIFLKNMAMTLPQKKTRPPSPFQPLPSICTASHINTEPLQRSCGAENEQPPASQPPQTCRRRNNTWRSSSSCLALLYEMFCYISPCNWKRWCDMELDGEEGLWGEWNLSNCVPACARKSCRPQSSRVCCGLGEPSCLGAVYGTQPEK